MRQSAAKRAAATRRMNKLIKFAQHLGKVIAREERKLKRLKKK